MIFETSDQFSPTKQHLTEEAVTTSHSLWSVDSAPPARWERDPGAAQSLRRDIPEEPGAECGQSQRGEGPLGPGAERQGAEGFSQQAHHQEHTDH